MCFFKTGAGALLTFTGSWRGSNIIGASTFGDVVIAPGVTTTLASVVHANSITVNGTLDLLGSSGFGVVVTGNTGLNAGGDVSFNGNGSLQTGSPPAPRGTRTRCPGRTATGHRNPGPIQGGPGGVVGRLARSPGSP